jgi:hypothetical protein
MLSAIVYMPAGHSTPTINRQCYIPVNSIVAEHGFCESLPKAHVPTGCDNTSSLHGIGKCVANTKLQDLVGEGNQSFTTFDMRKC